MLYYVLTVLSPVQRQTRNYVRCRSSTGPHYWSVFILHHVLGRNELTYAGDTNCNVSRMDIQPENHSNRIKVDEGYTNTGYWNITSTLSLIESRRSSFPSR